MSQKVVPASGSEHERVVLETCRDPGVSRPRVRCVSHFSQDLRVEFPRDLREKYPIGTRFLATVRVCQKHWNDDGSPKGPPYLRATNIGLIVRSIPDAGLRAKIHPDSVSAGPTTTFGKRCEHEQRNPKTAPSLTCVAII